MFESSEIYAVFSCWICRNVGRKPT